MASFSPNNQFIAIPSDRSDFNPEIFWCGIDIRELK